MTTWLHQERLNAVLRIIRESKAKTILDLGCGSGDLLLRLLEDPQITRIAALDISTEALARLRTRLAQQGGDARVELIHGSMTRPDPRLAGFDCAILIETIEHLHPADLPALERSLFNVLRPKVTVITTPNAEFNTLLGVPARRFRHPGHRFEWTRAQFRRWAEALAHRHCCNLLCHDIGGSHPALGGASQMAVLTRQAGAGQHD